jgi:CRISPR/Cas system-associated exonuclease Cas4 (RecB family)
MVYFLERIAKLLYEQNSGEIKNHCLVFPNRRAGLYFLKYYAAQLDKPAWTPAILTINDFFSSFSELVIADSEILLFELYKVYRELNSSAESFDEFYFWGDMLINDFDDVDKYMADAHVLFRNVQDFKNIDYQFGDIDQEQAEIIKRFWKNFEPEKHSPEKAGFKSIWSILNELYTGFNKSLRSRHLAYEGMILRDVAERYLDGKRHELKWKKVHFIGFNALNKCELTVMKKLQEEGLAKFYWDYDNSYIKAGRLNSAGLFMTKNLKTFRNDMPDDWNYETLLSSQNSNIVRNVIETTSDIAQVKLIPYLIDQIPGVSPEDAYHTAIILADENLIVPMLTSLPGNIGDINITMGYPLKMTGVYSLVKHLLNLQRNSSLENDKTYFGYKDVLEILKHQLIEIIINEDGRLIIDEIINKNLFRISSDFLCRSEVLKIIFRRTADPRELSDYLREILSIISADNKNDDEAFQDQIMQKNLRNEFIYSVLLSVNRLETIIKSPDVRFKNETYMRILDKILRNQSVPFSGEPLSGIQIMGFLETRALDFRNIIMLSVNEGILPSVTSGSSFIPFSIREAFGLPLINHQESIYAYHFFRLLHRAENVTFIYNSDSTGLRTGEMSRFLIQMKYEQIIKPSVLNLSFDIKTPASIGPVVEKNDLHMSRLNSLYTDNEGKSVLSPTAINTWLNCRMRFYYRYINGLKEPEVISPEIDHAVFGQILHRIMKSIYCDLVNREISSGFIDSLIRDESYLLNIIDRAINEYYGSDTKRPMSGNDIIIRDILLIYLLKILNADKSVAPFIISDLEKSFHFRLSLELNGKTVEIRTGGNVDRVDRLEGKTRIVDYKTGETAQRINSVKDLFADDRKKDLDGWLQTLLYCEAYLAGNPEVTVRPSIYKVKELSAERSSDILKIREEKNNDLLLDDYQTIREAFLEGLKSLVAIIFNPEEPFRMTNNSGKCGYCPYSSLCQR